MTTYLRQNFGPSPFIACSSTSTRFSFHCIHKFNMDTSGKSVPDHTNPANFPQSVVRDNAHVELTYSPLDVNDILNRVRSPHAGANVLFLGSTRDSFEDKPVSKLEYQSYPALALRSFSEIASNTSNTHKLTKISITHRLGTVPIGEDSIAIAVSAPHRGAAWKAGEEALERCKERAEVWKREDFADEPGPGEWRANRDQNSQGQMKEMKEMKEMKDPALGGHQRDGGAKMSRQLSRKESEQVWNQPWA